MVKKIKQFAALAMACTFAASGLFAIDYKQITVKDINGVSVTIDIPSDVFSLVEGRESEINDALNKYKVDASDIRKAEKAVKDAEKEAAKKAREAEKAVKDAEREVARKAREADKKAKEAEKAVKDAEKEVARILDEAKKQAEMDEQNLEAKAEEPVVVKKATTAKKPASTTKKTASTTTKKATSTTKKATTTRKTTTKKVEKPEEEKAA